LIVNGTVPRHFASRHNYPFNGDYLGYWRNDKTTAVDAHRSKLPGMADEWNGSERD